MALSLADKARQRLFNKKKDEATKLSEQPAMKRSESFYTSDNSKALALLGYSESDSESETKSRYRISTLRMNSTGKAIKEKNSSKLLREIFNAPQKDKDEKVNNARRRRDSVLTRGASEHETRERSASVATFRQASPSTPPPSKKEGGTAGPSEWTHGKKMLDIRVPTLRTFYRLRPNRSPEPTPPTLHATPSLSTVSRRAMSTCQVDGVWSFPRFFNGVQKRVQMVERSIYAAGPNSVTMMNPEKPEEAISYEGHFKSVTNVEGLKDYLVLIHENDLLCLWSLKKLKPVFCVEVSSRSVTAMAVSNTGDQTHIYICDKESKEIGIYDIPRRSGDVGLQLSTTRTVSVPPHHLQVLDRVSRVSVNHAVSCLLFHQNTDQLVAGTASSEIMCWKKEEDKWIALLGHTQMLFDIVVEKDTLYSCAWDFTIRLWSLMTHTCLSVVDVPTNVCRLKVQGSNIVCLPLKEPCVLVYNVKKKAMMELNCQHIPTSLTTTKNYLIAGTKTGSVKAWVVKTGASVFDKSVAEGAITHILNTPEGCFVFTESGGFAVCSLNATTPILPSISQLGTVLHHKFWKESVSSILTSKLSHSLEEPNGNTAGAPFLILSLWKMQCHLLGVTRGFLPPSANEKFWAALRAVLLRLLDGTAATSAGAPPDTRSDSPPCPTPGDTCPGLAGGPEPEASADSPCSPGVRGPDTPLSLLELAALASVLDTIVISPFFYFSPPLPVLALVQSLQELRAHCSLYISAIADALLMWYGIPLNTSQKVEISKDELVNSKRVDLAMVHCSATGFFGNVRDVASRQDRNNTQHDTGACTTCAVLASLHVQCSKCLDEWRALDLLDTTSAVLGVVGSALASMPSCKPALEAYLHEHARWCT